MVHIGIDAAISTCYCHLPFDRNFNQADAIIVSGLVIHNSLKIRKHSNCLFYLGITFSGQGGGNISKAEKCINL